MFTFKLDEPEPDGSKQENLKGHYQSSWWWGTLYINCMILIHSIYLFSKLMDSLHLRFSSIFYFRVSTMPGVDARWKRNRMWAVWIGRHGNEFHLKTFLNQHWPLSSANDEMDSNMIDLIVFQSLNSTQSNVPISIEFKYSPTKLCMDG